MITYAYESGTNKQDDAFNYDLVGNILNIISELNDCGIAGSLDGANKLNRSFSYDPLYRLLTATGRESDTQEQNDYLYADAPIPGSPNANNVRAYTRKYTYDKIGNILKMQQIATGNSFTRNFVYNTGVNTLQKIETGSSATIEAFTYDPCGNQLTAGTSRHYVWDAANQLQVYKNQAGSSNPTVFAQYQYAGGSRVSKMVRTGTDVSPIYERIIYIDGVFEYHKLENDSTYEKNYVHVMDDASRIAMVRVNVPSQTYPGDISESVTYILEDQIGSSVARLDTNGGLIDKEEYYPFGDSSLRTFTKKSYRYTGKEKDAESGLYYYGARYYSAWTCRFISVDPLASDYPFYTPYHYCSNNPINRIDPDGMQDEPSGGGEQGNNTTTQNMQVHSVQKGETLSEIAKQYGTTVDALAQTNNISDPNKIQVGQKLNIGENSNIPLSESQINNISLGSDIGTLNVVKYGPVEERGEHVGAVWGAVINLEFNPASNSTIDTKTDVNYIQTVHTNVDWQAWSTAKNYQEGLQVQHKETTFVDPYTKDNPDQVKFYGESIETKLPNFGDYPGIPKIETGVTFFRAETSVVINRGDGFERIATFTWGYSISAEGQTSLDPIKIVNPSPYHNNALNTFGIK